ncbi:secretory lipase [Rhodococcus sp. OK302]|nr:alpha/beta fold hydrolase [Rhodococcus sp. OK302]OYD67413.1 secretory lipase [Rhodococcus sp. OK302]
MKSRMWWVAGMSVAALVVSAATAPFAAAEPTDFYTPPTDLPPGSNGDLIKAEPTSLMLSVPGSNGPWPATATKIMYRSEDAEGVPVAVTGTYLEPVNPWTGQGARPMVAAAVGTHGQGDQCAPSKLFNTGLEYRFPTDVMVGYESIWVNMLLLNGIAVVVTDYDGLGTPGDHTYVNRAAEAYAVLDSVRAAQQLPNASISGNGPVGLWGYSQGGGAAAAATELKPSYAPELDLKGTYAGAPPADLAATLAQVDGTFLTGVIGYALNGILAQYPEVEPLIDAEINDRGRQMLAATKNQCVGETGLEFGFQDSSSFTKSGESLSAVLARLPLAQEILDEQKIGNLTPTSPVLIQHGRSDDIVPFGQGQELARDWCNNGATVQFSMNELPPIIPGMAVNHVATYVAGTPESVGYMIDRFNNVPAPSNC